MDGHQQARGRVNGRKRHAVGLDQRLHHRMRRQRHAMPGPAQSLRERDERLYVSP